jgi:DNA-binding winged helix-turn-helix (wHTH) protein
MAHGDRSVDVFVRKLRQKLRAASRSWSYIHTHFGVGYRFAPERENSVEEELDLMTGRHPAEPLEPLESLDSALAG